MNSSIHASLLKRFSLGIVSACLLSLSSLTVFAQADESAGQDLLLPLDEVRIFTEVLNRIRSAYVEPIDDKTLLENAIKGMLAGIDPHSTYLASDDYDQLQESTTGEFGGLGVEVGIEDGFIKVIAPMDGSPAAIAGVQAGDLIIKLDDTPAREVTLGDTVDLMRGEPGTDIVLTILREGVSDPFVITVTREIIQSRSVRSRVLEPGYAYIRVASFSVDTGTEVKDALKKLHEENALKGVVMDLRNNPGGVLQSSVGVVDAFITEGLIVYTEGRIDNSEMRFEASNEDPSQGVPLVVLINSGSASASEIVAGALQDHQRAIIMGTPSFGKGSVQTVLPLTNDRAIKLTTALYFTPNGRSIQAKGIVPDITVDRGQVTRIPDSLISYREADLTGHLENGNAADDSNEENATENEEAAVIAAETQEPPEVLVRDYQLNEAVNVLKGLNIIRPRIMAESETQLIEDIEGTSAR
ncbi:MAG: S41 family peptidase [Gammaproteobacteria bacterium]|nr:S41 family peptidase [Gammaproteobacteria bacterium]